MVLVDRTPVGELGLTICYDLRFPGLFARLAEADADLIAVPRRLHCPDRQGALAHSPSRASDRGWAVRRRGGTGRAPRRRSPDLRPFARRRSVGRGSARHGRRARIGFADVDLKRIADVRSRVPALRHRRPIPDATTLSSSSTCIAATAARPSRHAYRSSDDYEEQRRAGMVECPFCRSANIGKAPMAPQVPRKGSSSPLARLAAMQTEMLQNFRWVGDKFTETARAIHSGEMEPQQVQRKRAPDGRASEVARG